MAGRFTGLIEVLGSSVDQIVLNPDGGQDNSVQLPFGAINPNEILAEPGVAGDLNGDQPISIPSGLTSANIDEDLICACRWLSIDSRLSRGPNQILGG